MRILSLFIITLMGFANLSHAKLTPGSAENTETPNQISSWGCIDSAGSWTIVADQNSKCSNGLKPVKLSYKPTGDQLAASQDCFKFFKSFNGISTSLATFVCDQLEANNNLGSQDVDYAEIDR